MFLICFLHHTGRDNAFGAVRVNIVWFKRDLRVWDHAALAAAAASGPVLPLYIVEPDLWAQPDLSARHYAFLSESLTALSASLARLGQPLIIRTGDAVDVLAALAAEHDVTAIYTHQETWNGWTYDRDRRVNAWARRAAITIYESQQHGVHRAMASRRGWAPKWDAMMRQPVTPAPAWLAPVPAQTAPLPTAAELGLAPDPCPQRQPGGRPAGIAQLKSFLEERGRGYRFEMSSPVTAPTSCSRLSPYLAFGCLSMREVYQASQRRRHALREANQSPGAGGLGAADLTADPRDRTSWLKSLTSFNSRLHWHCHFIQKLEDEPEAEFRAFHPAYREWQKDTPDAAARLLAWQTGQTGYPLVDACMRSLAATGWLTFRMRAMVMSFASYHLWLDWRRPALHLARQFVDYEPGIHYSQCQMQSGITGINTIRIYNPVKQSQDQDKAGHFIRNWVPELAAMPDALVHTPWLKPALAPDYPAPLVDEKLARKQAASQIYAIRRTATHRHAATHVVAKHASRREGGITTHRDPRPSAKATAPQSAHKQMDLGLESP
jgi:deoxyribodipyrimidine photo-lyase